MALMYQNAVTLNEIKLSKGIISPQEPPSSIISIELSQIT